MEIEINFIVNSRCSSGNELEFFDNNMEHREASFGLLSGNDKLLAGGPTSIFKYTTVPSFTR